MWFRFCGLKDRGVIYWIFGPFHLSAPMSRLDIHGTFRPTDESLSSRQKSQVQAHRLLFLLGAVLCLLFIPPYEISKPDAIDPVWARVAVSGLLAGCFGASYVSSHVRHNFASWVWASISLIIGWFILITGLNGFSSDYGIGLLLLHAVFTVISGVGARSIRPVLWFTTGSLAATVGAVVLSTGSLIGEVVLMCAMATVSLVVGIVVQRLISTRKKVQERESRLRGLANSIPGVVFRFYARPDGSWGNYFVSKHAEEVLGISSAPDTFLDRALGQVPEPYREKALASIEEAISERRNWKIEVPFEKPSGEQIWLLGTSTPEAQEDEIVYNGFLLDITDRKRAERELREAKEEAVEASEVKTAMLANMSHEIRTPLTSIVGFSEILTDELEGDLQNLARQTHESSNRLSRTLESILQLSKLEAGAATLNREQVTLDEVVQETAELLRPKAEEKSIAIGWESPDNQVEGFWNENALRRISRNLLENAIKFTPEEGEVEVRVGRAAGEALLEVEDTGIGISEKNLPHIFEAFRQESEGIEKQYAGSGLGLSIVDHLVSELGGTVDVETEKDEGTRFIIHLPLVEEQKPSRIESSPPSTVSGQGEVESTDGGPRPGPHG